MCFMRIYQMTEVLEKLNYFADYTARGNIKTEPTAS